MTFSEKLSKVLETNAIGIASAFALEKFLNAGEGRINRYIRAGREPTLKLKREIIMGLGINPERWKTGKGEIYRENLTFVKESHDKGAGDEDPWQVIKHLIKQAERDERRIKELEAENASLKDKNRAQ